MVFNNNKKAIDVSKDEQVVLQPDNNLPAKRPIYIRTLNVFINPMRGRFERHYRDKKYHFATDLFLLIIIVLLLIINGILLFKKIDPLNISVPKHQATISDHLLDIQYFNDIGGLPVSAGDQLSYTLIFKNISSYPLENIQATVNLAGATVDLSSIKTQGEIDGQQIIWSEKQNESLAKIDPGQELILGFSINVLSQIPISNPIITSQAFFTGRVNGQFFTQSSNALVKKINSNLTINSIAKYTTTEGEQLGLGPWPPQVGQSTTLRIFLDIRNTVNNLKNTVLTASLPTNINWTGHTAVSAGQPLVFNEQTRQISWQIGDVNTHLQPTANFEVEFTPLGSNQSNQLLLVKDIMVTANDTFTGANLKSQQAAVYCPQAIE